MPHVAYDTRSFSLAVYLYLANRCCAKERIHPDHTRNRNGNANCIRNLAAPLGGFFRGSLKEMDKTNVPAANESCVTHTSEEMERHNKWNAGSEAPLRAAGVTLVSVWASTRDTFAAHVGRGDCTHFCQPGLPAQWAGMLADALGMAMSKSDRTNQFSSRSRRD